VLIYFDQATKIAVLERLARITEPDGYLILGAAETVVGLTEVFRPLLDRRGLYAPNPAKATAAGFSVLKAAALAAVRWWPTRKWASTGCGVPVLARLEAAPLFEEFDDRGRDDSRRQHEEDGIHGLALSHGGRAIRQARARSVRHPTQAAAIFEPIP